MLAPLKTKGTVLSILLGAAVTLIVLLSFSIYSPYFMPRLNSDHAVHILMAYDLRLPEDLYFWGQDRLGSLIPILTHALLQLLPVHPVLAIAWVQYAFLIGGYLAFASLLQRPLPKLILALIWFLPLRPFNELTAVAQPYGPQLALIGVALALINWLQRHSGAVGSVRRQVILFAITASLVLSIWVSDFSAFTTLILIGVLLLPVYWRLYRNLFQSKSPPDSGLDSNSNPNLNPNSNPKFPHWWQLGLPVADRLTIALTTLVGIGFIAFAKESATSEAEDYGAFGSLAQIQSVVTELVNSFIAALTFQYKPFMGIHAILVICLFVYVSYLLLKPRQEPLAISQWTMLFFLNASLGMLVLVSLQWVHKNGVNLRYFVVVYVSTWLAALLFADRLPEKTARRLGILLLATAIASVLTLPPRTFSLQRPPSRLAKLAEVQKLAPAGFIGNYWSSYIICTANPAQLDCTPNDTEAPPRCLPNPETQDDVRRVRCRRCIPRVLAANTIYLVKERWLKSFPQEIQQFRTCLVKVGEPFSIGDFTLAPYQKRGE